MASIGRLLTACYARPWSNSLLSVNSRAWPLPGLTVSKPVSMRIPSYSWPTRFAYQIETLAPRCYGYKYLVVIYMRSLSRRLALALSMIALLVAPARLALGQSNSAENAPLKIGYLMDSLKIERWQTDLDIFQKRAKELGAVVLVETAEGDDELQLQQSQKLMDSGVKVLVLVPHDTEKAARIVSAAKARHVPVLRYERLVRDSDVDFFVGTSAEMIGELQASWLARLAPKGNYVLIGGSSSDFNAKFLRDGQMRVLMPFVDRGAIKIVSDGWAKDWDPAEAYALMSKAIDSTNGDVAAVVASNDGTAGGAIQALQEHKLAGKVLVSGQDADLAAIIRILDGTQTMTVYKPIGRQAALAAEAAVSLASGAPVKNAVSIANGTRTVHALLLSPMVVTKDNVKQTVIKDGFQNLETIEKSLPRDKWPN
jgi:D-xylose transport system substrate-binding protein